MVPASNHDAPLYFFHVPKTGGTTLQHLLEGRFPPGEICPAQDEPGIAGIDTADLARYRLFAGHYWSLPRRLASPLRMMTWLRDPLDRALSMYKHILRDPGHPLYAQALEGGRNPALLEHPALRNSQVRHLARVHEDYRRTLDDAACLPLARAVVDRCFFVGFTEDYADSLARLWRLLGWGEVSAAPRLNTAAEHSPGVEIAPDLRRDLAAANEVDGEIYRYARLRSC